MRQSDYGLDLLGTIVNTRLKTVDFLSFHVADALELSVGLVSLHMAQGVPGPVILDELRVHCADTDSCIMEILNNLFIVTGRPCLHPLNFGDVLFFSSIGDMIFNKSRNKVERGIKR